MFSLSLYHYCYRSVYSHLPIRDSCKRHEISSSKYQSLCLCCLSHMKIKEINKFLMSLFIPSVTQFKVKMWMNNFLKICNLYHVLFNSKSRSMSMSFCLLISWMENNLLTTKLKWGNSNAALIENIVVAEKFIWKI